MLLSAAPAAVFLLLQFPPAKQKAGVPMAEVARLARDPMVLLISFLLFFESGNEFVLGGYISTYLVREANAPVGTASYVLAGYWAAIMVTRIASSRLLLWMKGSTLILASAALTAAGYRTADCRALGGCLRRRGGAHRSRLRQHLSTTLGVAGSRFAAYSGTVFGIIFTIALVGGMSLPWAVGQVAAARGMRWV